MMKDKPKKPKAGAARKRIPSAAIPGGDRTGGKGRGRHLRKNAGKQTRGSTTEAEERYNEAYKEMMRQKPDLAKAAELLRNAMEKGEPRAAYALATWYLHGRYFRRSLRKAVSLLRVAAKESVPEALYDLAVCYEIGAGVKKSEKMAAKLYLRAALWGEKQSVYEVGRCYFWGIGVKQDRGVAWVWLSRAEELGVS